MADDKEIEQVLEGGVSEEEVSPPAKKTRRDEQPGDDVQAGQSKDFAEKIRRLDAKEMKQHATAAAEAGVGGLTMKELAVGSMFSEETLFKYMPDKVERVRAEQV